MIMAGCGRLFTPVGCVNFLSSRCMFTNPFQCISMKVKKAMEEYSIPQKPKKPLTPFFKYLKVMRPRIVNEFPQFKTTEVVKKISEKWAQEDKDYKLKLHQEYDVEYKQYMQKVVEYEKSLTPDQRVHIIAIQDQINAETEKTKLKRSIKQLGKPTKPPSAFILYINEKMKEKESNISMQEFIRSLSLQWKDLNKQEKEQYHTQAAKLMEQYTKEKTKWEQKMIESDIYKAKKTHGKATNYVFSKYVTVT